MDYLIRFGLTIDEIKTMMDANITIGSNDDNEIDELITVLRENNCSDKLIKKLLLANPFYLNQEVDDVKKIIQKLLVLGLNDIKTICETDPFILNYEAIEFEHIINKKRSEGLNDSEIRDYVIYNLV